MATEEMKMFFRRGKKFLLSLNAIPKQSVQSRYHLTVSLQCVLVLYLEVTVHYKCKVRSARLREM